MPMKVEKLVAQRKKDGREIKPFPVSDEELIQRYEKLWTAAVNDVLRENMFLYQSLPSNITPLDDEKVSCGIAFTIKGLADIQVDPNDMARRGVMLDEIPKNSFIVWDTSGDTESAQWGEMMTKAAKQKGCRGAAVDGGLRDTRQVKGLNFPLWTKYKTSNAMMGRFRIIDWQVPIKIGTAFCYPGDVVLADIDGVLIIPREQAWESLLRAEEIQKEEVEIAKWVDSGMTAKEVIDKGGYF
ncbi:RraA family protein [Oceanispirochaeta sp.]|jgi:4-hydroxy-4-methyl-2-oxoglutarate aldolase|uniref:RraA family protein n=1 Tax=Oceanispirochaeta sp. TaxID=2035350 RepID=UPI00261E7297|nr:RraA family protein [Oceanispirochaeta sp.]MDA3955116.1 RraA family protein [Oceanispirochaeta sp.]